MLKQIVDTALNSHPELVRIRDVVEKEILHHDILEILMGAGALSRMTLRGGTCLRLCYNSSRLSEDLDFTAGSNFQPEMLEGIDVVLKSKLESNYQLDIAVHKPVIARGDTSTWKITIEKFANRPDLPSQKIRLDVCAYPSLDRTKRPLIDHYQTRSSMHGLLIPAQSLAEILCDKLIAFAYRERRIKPRDVWDLVWLSQQNIVPDCTFIVEKLQLREKSQASFLKKIKHHCQLIKESEEVKTDFYQEMTRFVSRTVATTSLEQPSFWEYVGIQVSDYVATTERLLSTQGGAELPFKM